MTPAQRDSSSRLRIFNYAKQIGNVSAACRHFGISREIYYRWKRACEKDGEQALVNSKPSPEKCRKKNPPPSSDIPLREGKTPYEILLEKLQSNPTSTEFIPSTHNT